MSYLMDFTAFSGEQVSQGTQLARKKVEQSRGEQLCSVLDEETGREVVVERLLLCRRCYVSLLLRGYSLCSEDLVSSNVVFSTCRDTCTCWKDVRPAPNPLCVYMGLLTRGKCVLRWEKVGWNSVTKDSICEEVGL